jgi:uncharacterized short protein YbdD (DUF466 family)
MEEALDDKKCLPKHSLQVHIQMAISSTYDDYLAEAPTGSPDKTPQGKRKRFKNHRRHARRWLILVGGTLF